MQAIPDQGLHRSADVAFKVLGRLAIVDAQRKFGFQQVLHRAAIQRFLNTEDVDGTTEIVHVPVQQSADQVSRVGVLKIRLDRRLVQPKPE